ncbi:MAG: hypothetical protein ACM3WR_00195 [Solirubrobacterales bacterium]
MDDERLHTYLNDHLAGASAALAMTVRLAADHADDAFGPPLARLRDEIRLDREAVRDALARLPARENPWKRVAGIALSLVAWGRDLLPSGARPTLAEELEVLAMGVWGKRLLWGALARVAESDPRFEDLDLEALTARAEDHERELLRLREDALVDAFGLRAAERG